MDERGEKNETTEEINIRHRRHRRGKKSKRTSNYDTQPEKASHTSENHSGGTSKTPSRGKLESIKTSTNDKVIEENHTSGEKDNEDAGVSKKRKGIKDKKQKDSRNKKSDNYDWDYMKVTRKDEHSDVQNCCIWKKLQAFAKVIFIAFTSIFVLATAVISKLCLISITSNLLPPTNVTDSFMNVTDSFWWHKTAGSSFRFKNQQTDMQWIWALILVISAPYIFTVIGSGWQLLLRKQKQESEWEGFGKKMLRETLHSVGICMMAFVLLPSIDPIAGTLVCFHVATIPGLLELCHRFYNKFKTYLHRVFLAIALLLQVVGIALACAYYVLESKTEIRILQVITICFSPVLVSCSWWENYVPFLKNQTKIYPKVGSENHHGAQNVTNSVPENQSKTPGPRKNLIRYRSAQFNLLANLLKVTITVLVPIILFGVQCPNGSECIGSLFGVSLNSTFRNRVGISVLSSTKSFGDCTNYLPLTVAIVSIICSGACYYAAQIGCKILAKITCLSIPLTIASPTALGALFVILSRDANVESCFLPFPLWGTDSSVLLNHIRSSNYGLIIVSGICGYISLWIICYHIWIPEKRGLRKSDKLSAKPLYCGILTDQSIRLNIKRTDMDHDKSGENKEKVPSSTNPRIYLCATMWHESESEMKKLIESIIRLDKKNSLKRKSNEERRESLSNEDSFHFEAHIFFDDAFEMRKEDPGKGRIILNQYVENLINVMQEVHGNQPLKVRKSTTAYGGRLQWKLISGSVIYAHLKNKNIVRCKKRWSQVMYMYFILGHKEVHKQKDIEDKDDAHDKRRKERLENTFIMALDGDVDFKPEAIDYLIDRMRKDPMVGAACGRIHPTGSGPVVWYQKFEYAVSHWLQKVPEDVIGCVLCSPGCFSLFRGSALVADNVLKVYTSSPEKGRHHIQYDLGEDRWLCTLLLQAGFKIEYVAVSEALTKAPEGFNEFFNQRRRWIPSTLANLLDLLIEWNHVVKQNPYICRMFLFYELCVMVSTILTPGTICLLIAGALTIAFPLLPLWVALLFTILPVAAFIIVCFKATSETQLTFAAVLSMLYALVMMVVLVGLLVHMVQNGLCSITTMFFIYVGMVFLTTAVLHPKEIACVCYGFLYFIAIPCTSLIMMIYALCNLNVTSWGTRETTKRQDIREGIRDNQRVWMQASHGIGPLIRCFCCTQVLAPLLQSDITDPVKTQPVSDTNETTNVGDISVSIQMTSREENAGHILDSAGSESRTIDQEKGADENGTQTSNINPPDTVQQSPRKEVEQPLTSRDWMDNQLLEDAQEKRIKTSETNFWKRMMRLYLRPLNHNDTETKQVEQKLRKIRNEVCLFFIICNSLLVCVIFTLQQITAQSNVLSIPYPCGAGENRVKYVEPITFVFTAMFGIILTVQFFCMLLHRFRTLIHVLSRTDMCSKANEAEAKIDISIAERIEQL